MLIPREREGKMRAGTILRVLAKLHVVGVSSTHSDNGKASSHGNVMDDGGYERKRRIPPLLCCAIPTTNELCSC